MSIGVQTFQGSRLKEARLARGLFKNALGEMIGVTGTAVANYEEGKDKPQHDKLIAIASKLNFDYEFFLRPSWPELIEPVFWRSYATETKTAREMAEQRMRWLCETFSFLESELDFPSYDIPKVTIPSDFRLLTPEDIEASAEMLRSRWKLGLRPIPDVTLALENIGIPVVNMDIASEKQDGFCFYSQHLGRSFVGINTYSISCSRARYDCAHELGHIILHSNVTATQQRDQSLHKQIEDQANRFAGAFLFPREAFYEEARSLSLDYFASLKKRWGISIGAMIFRASNLGMIDKDERGALFRNLTRRGWRGALREPFDNRLEMPMERPRMIKRGVEALLNEGFYSKEGLRSSLAFPEHDIEQIVGVSNGFLRTAEMIQLPVPKKTRHLRVQDLESGELIEFTKWFRK